MNNVQGTYGFWKFSETYLNYNILGLCSQGKSGKVWVFMEYQGAFP